MGIGLVGKKIGMTRIFLEAGDSVPVTILDVSGNRVTGVKNSEKHGYSAVQIGFGVRLGKRSKKSELGEFGKGDGDVPQVVKEFRVGDASAGGVAVGDLLPAETFAEGQFVDVSGKSKGKGFSGVIKRHNFSSNRASHGNSLGHNKPGSTGNAQDPGRVFPGKKMAGQYGAANRTIQNLQVMKVDAKRQLIMIKGSFAGFEGSMVFVKPSKKIVGAE